MNPRGVSREAVGREREPVNLPSFFGPKRRLSSFLSSGGEVAFGMQNTHRLLGSGVKEVWKCDLIWMII